MNTSPREILSRILDGLRSDDPTLQLAALRDLGQLNYSSGAVVCQLESLAIHGVTAVRQAALDALDSRPNQYVRSQTLKHVRPHRHAILAETHDWAERGLIGPEVAEVLVRRYDTSRKPSSAIEAAEIATPVPAPVKRAVAPAAPVKPRKVAPPTAAAPAPTLGERLLSQTSINIALYLGAFLVVGAAAILAALVEVTRLPILLGGTALFGAGAVTVKQRLPQPSFVLFMIFSFLLPISANVLADSLYTSGQTRDGYWAAASLLMAVAWGFGTWLYASRVFSLAAFAAWAVAVYRVGALGELSDAWNGVGLVVAGLGGLGGTHALKAWKDRRFALPIFLCAQALVAGALLWSAWYAATALFQPSPDSATGTWIAMSLTCVAGAVFYAWSALEYTFQLFVWIAAACLVPVSWLVLRSLRATSLVESVGLWAWGALFAAAAEASRRTSRRLAGEMHWPLLLGSLVLLMAAVAGGFLDSALENTPLAYAFAIAAAAALVCTAMTILRPRAYLWLAGLLFGLAAYFTVFALPFAKPLQVYAGYRLLGASLLLLLPEIFFATPFARSDPWRGPLLRLGVIVTAINLGWLVLSGISNADPKAIIMAVYAMLLAAYALHLRRTWIGYLAAASAAAAANYAVQRYGLDVRMAVLTGLSVAFFAVGFVLRRYERHEWASVLRLSGLALGAIVTAVGFADSATWGNVRSSTLGFDVLAIAVLFVAEAYLRLDAPIEASGPFFASLAGYLILRRFGVPDLAFHLLAFSLIWLTADMLYSRTLKPRLLGIPTRVMGGLLALANVPALLYHGYPGGHAEAAAIAFLVYAAFFAFSAWFYRMPSVSFACTASVSLGILLAVEYLNSSQWPAALTGFALLCYVAGYLFRRRGREWGRALRISSLAVAAAVVIATVYLVRANVAWCALLAAGFFLAETYVSGEARLEIGAPALLSAAAFLGLRDLHVTEIEYHGLVISLIWLAADLLYAHTRHTRPWANVTRYIGGAIAATTALALIAPVAAAAPQTAALCFGVYAAFFAAYAWLYREPRLGYVATASLPLATYFLLRSLQQDNWLYGVAVIALLLYGAGYMLRRGGEQHWSRMLLVSGLIIGTVNSLSAPIRGGLDSAIPVALAATLFAAEAFARQNVWLAFPANILYLESYFLILTGLEVDQPQFFSIGAALLGMLMHYLLVRSRNPRGAFVTGLFSQLVLLGTTFIQLLSTKELGYFVVIFFQGLAVLTYGIIARSRSLVIAPIAFIVVSVIAVLYTALKGIGTVVLIGGAGIVLLVLGITAVLMRERIATIGDRLSAWQA